jgi:hypothetical protein
MYFFSALVALTLFGPLVSNASRPASRKRPALCVMLNWVGAVAPIVKGVFHAFDFNLGMCPRPLSL